jgi:predicted transposase YbfD/YdcC
MSDPVQPPFLSQFAALRDPRQAAKVLYPLPEVLLLLLCGTIAGADDFVELALWGGERLAFLRRFLPYARGVPSHDTLCEVVAALDPELFRTCFANWVERLRRLAPAPEASGPASADVDTSVREMIALDGKTSRRSHARSRGRGPLHTVSAWASGQRLVLGQETVSDKSNEITAIPLLLQRLELAGALVTIDAMGTQTAIAQTVLDRGGDYLLALKQNRPETFASVKALFAEPPPGLLISTHQTVDGGHGRVETRTHRVCHEIGWLFSDRRYPCPKGIPRRDVGNADRDEPRFPGLAMIGMVESTTERSGKVEQEKRYYLGSAKLDADTFARAARSHWDIENRLHWMLDVVFHDDLARLRTGHGPANMAVVKHMALNLLHQARPTLSLKNRRKRAGWNPDYLAHIIQQTT